MSGKSEKVIKGVRRFIAIGLLTGEVNPLFLVKDSHKKGGGERVEIRKIFIICCGVGEKVKGWEDEDRAS